MKKMSPHTTNNTVGPQVQISKVPINVVTDYKLNKECDWVKELLIEANENSTEFSVEEKLEKTELNIDISLEKQFKGEHGEYLLADITISGNFLTECVKTLKTMPEMLHFFFKACFLDERFQNDEMYVDQTEIFINNSLYELYFSKKGIADLKEICHEQINLNIDPYPTFEATSEPQ